LQKSTFRANTDGGMGQGARQKFWALYLFLQLLKVATSNLVYNLGCGNMIQKLLLRPKWHGCGIGSTPQILGCFLAHTHANFSPKSCFLVCYSWKQSCVPNLKSLGSTVAKIIKKSQNFSVAPLVHTPAKSSRESFLACYLSNPSCVLNLKSLTLIVAEISRGSQNCVYAKM